MSAVGSGMGVEVGGIDVDVEVGETAVFVAEIAVGSEVAGCTTVVVPVQAASNNKMSNPIDLFKPVICFFEIKTLNNKLPRLGCAATERGGQIVATIDIIDDHAIGL